MSAPTVLPGRSDFAKENATQFGFVNLLKVVATQLIVLHHLAFYGPMSDHVRPLMPDLIGWLESNARIAVQVFLVIGGFLAAKSLGPKRNYGISDSVATVLRRYGKLVPPFLVATGLAVVVSAGASQWMSHDSISAPPNLLQLAAHALLLQGILGYESLWAGAWYVAIDFQLYAALVMLIWLAGRLSENRRVSWVLPVLVGIGISASLLHFNRDASWDIWAPYFFGSYGLGVMAWWASDRKRGPMATALLLAAILIPTLLALIMDFRSRIAVALLVACALVLVGRHWLQRPGRASAIVNRFGRESYSVFLVHFPVCIMVNAVFTCVVPPQPFFQAGGMLVAWGACVVAGAAFYRWVEVPLSRVSMVPGSVMRLTHA